VACSDDEKGVIAGRAAHSGSDTLTGRRRAVEERKPEFIEPELIVYDEKLADITTWVVPIGSHTISVDDSD
jgi:hypothetical protein